MSSNIVEFKPRKSAPQVLEQRQVENDQSAPIAAEMAVINMLRALEFYAMQGWDGGQKARVALIDFDISMSAQQAVAEEEPLIVA